MFANRTSIPCNMKYLRQKSGWTGQFGMATQNDYGYVWMNPNQMVMPESGSVSQVPTDIMSMDQTQMDSGFYPMSVPSSFDTVNQTPMELDGFMMMDDFDGDYCGEPPRFMTTATQTIANARRKIRPVKHPGLKLQTPIAYKCDTDPSVIPIQKDGMAICEKCGAIGVKHAFYTRFRKYCSLACARGSLGVNEVKDGKELEDENSQSQDYSSDSTIFRYPNGTTIKAEDEMVTKDILPLTLPATNGLPSFNLGPGMGTFSFPSLVLPEDPVPPIQNMRIRQEHALSFDWKVKLANPNFVAASVNLFKHAPMADCWDDITVGMKVEVENTDCEELYDFPCSFWVATVLKLAGYKALLRYEGFNVADKDFWVDLCSSNVHPVGWCAMRGKPLIPPKSIAEKYKDWKEFLVKRLTGARTLPTNFYSKVQESLKSRFRVGMNVEVVDKGHISQVCLANVRRITGKRLHVSYFDAEYDDGFWCHEDSPLLHPVGWAIRVKHEIKAPAEYLERCESGLMEKDDAADELFTAPYQSFLSGASSQGFNEGMRLEAIDPLNLSTICAATVMRVLDDGYLMIRIDKYAVDIEAKDRVNWFCYHASSPCIFPAGFCHKNGIPLEPPAGFDAEAFNWESVVKDTGCILAPHSLFVRDIPDHGFKPGMQLESADVMTPQFVCVATIDRVVGRLLKVHFDGWEDIYDQWLDCCSPDIYPVGWCSLVSHKLEAPKVSETQEVVVPEKKKPVGRKKKLKGRTKGVHGKKQTDISPSNDVPVWLSTIMDKDVSIVSAESSQEEERFNVSCPIATEDAPSFVPSVPSNLSAVFIPRLVDGPPACDGDLNPSTWTCNDVASFLKLNDCAAHADNFLAAGKDGPALLSLTQDQIMLLTGMKFGPTLKIYDLINQLKVKAAKANMKKSL